MTSRSRHQVLRRVLDLGRPAQQQKHIYLHTTLHTRVPRVVRLTQLLDYD